MTNNSAFCTVFKKNKNKIIFFTFFSGKTNSLSKPLLNITGCVKPWMNTVEAA